MLRRLLLAPLLLAAACGGDDPAAPAALAPQTEIARDGLRYSARVELIANEVFPSKPPAFFTVLVTLQNTRTAPAVRTSPVGCPVRLRLERPDGSAVLDESQRPCTQQIVTIEVPGTESVTLTTGLYAFETLRIDGVPRGDYEVVALVATEGDPPLRLRAGTVAVR
jgi:hypothetical protein